MKLAGMLAAAIGAAGGCLIHTADGETALILPGMIIVDRDEDAHRPPVGTVWTEEARHTHDAHCGHYWYDGRWYQWRDHVHGPRCGHVFHNGVWVLAGAVRVARGHVHDAHCGHYHWNGHWYYMRGHRHGHSCGHHWDGRMWIYR